MANTISVNVVSLEASVYTGEALQIQASCIKGDVGIFPGHAPFLAELIPGPVRIVRPGTEEDDIVYVSGGILEVQPNQVTVLADTVIRCSDIEEQAVIQAREEAAKLLSEQGADIDYAHAKTELIRAAAMLRTLSLLRKQIR